MPIKSRTIVFATHCARPINASALRNRRLWSHEAVEQKPTAHAFFYGRAPFLSHSNPLHVCCLLPQSSMKTLLQSENHNKKNYRKLRIAAITLLFQEKMCIPLHWGKVPQQICKGHVNYLLWAHMLVLGVFTGIPTIISGKVHHKGMLASLA